MTSAGGQFSYSDDSVVAKVAVDFPASSSEAFGRINAEAEKLAAHLQMVSRSQGDFLRHLENMPAMQGRVLSAQKEYEQSLRRTAEYSERIAKAQGTFRSGGSGSSLPQVGGRAAPSEYVDHSQAQGGRHGTGREAPLAPADAAQMALDLEWLKQNNPRQYENVLAQRGYNNSQRAQDTEREVQDAAQNPQARPRRRSSEAAPVPEPAARQAASAHLGMGIMGDLLSEMGNPRGNLLTTALSIHNRVSAWRDRTGRNAEADTAPTSNGGEGGEGDEGEEGSAGEEGGAGSGAPKKKPMGKFAKAGLGLGVAAAGYGLVQAGGKYYQDTKNLGNMYGGGFSQGLDYQMSIQYMAMSPFLSTEQSRQIIMGALSSGYQPGKSYEMITDFLADNMKDFGLSVSDQMGMITKNIQQNGGTLSGQRQALSNAMSLASSPGNMMTFKDIVSQGTQISNTLENQGVNGDSSAQMGTAIVGMVNSSPALSQSIGSTITSALQSTTNQAALVQFAYQHGMPAGTPPTMASGYVAQLAQQGKISKGEAVAAALGSANPNQGLNALYQSVGGDAAFAGMDPNNPDLGKYGGKLYQFALGASKYGINYGQNWTQWANFIVTMMHGGNLEANATASDAKQVAQAAQSNKLGVGASLGNAVKGGLSSVGSGLHVGLGAITGAASWLGSVMFGNGDTSHAFDTMHHAEAQGQASQDNFNAATDNQQLRQWVSEYGGQKNIYVKDDKGNVTTLNEADAKQVQALTAVGSKYQLSTDKKSWATYSDAVLGNGVPGDTGQNKAGGPGGTIELSGEAKRWFVYLQNNYSNNNLAADQSYNNTQHNNPAPGGGIGGPK